MKRYAHKGQSILEYTLLLAGVIAVIVLVFFGSGGNRGGLQGKIGDAYNATGDALSNTTADLSQGVFGP